MKSNSEISKKVLTAYQSRVIMEALQTPEVRQQYLDWLSSDKPQEFPADIFKKLPPNIFGELDLNVLEESLFLSYEEELPFITGLGFLPNSTKCALSTLKCNTLL